MPKSKPPRRQRPRHVPSRDREMVDFFDRLERIIDRAECEAEALADRIPAEELALMRQTCAENRRIFAEARADRLAPSRTPVLDRLVQDMRRRERQAAAPR